MREFSTRKCGGKRVLESELKVGDTVYGEKEAGKRVVYVCVTQGQAIRRTEHMQNRRTRRAGNPSSWPGWAAGMRSSHGSVGIYPPRA